MSGKVCDGTTNVPHNLKLSRAYCEGRAARAAEVSPTNPHPAGDDADAWDRGVASKVADDPDGCCAPTGAAAV